MSTVLANISSIIVPLTALATFISWIIGAFMIFKAVMMLRKFGQQQTSMHENTGPLVYLIVGAILVYIPSSTDVMLNSFFNTTNSIFDWGNNINYQQMGQGSDLLGYVSGQSLSAQWGDLANTLVLYVQFVGYLSFIKGWIMLSKMGSSQGSQQGAFTKGLIHIIGGVVAINVVGTYHILQNTVLGTG